VLCVTGCGGNNLANAGPTGETFARFEVSWPQATRFIHERSDSVRITASFEDGTSPHSVVVNRDPGSQTSVVSMPIASATGQMRFHVEAYDSHQASLVLSEATVYRVLTPGSVNEIAFTLESDVASILIQKSPLKATYNVGDVVQLSPIAKNASGDIILGQITDFNFRSENPNVASVEPGGLVTILSKGDTFVIVQEEGAGSSGRFPDATVELTSVVPLAGKYHLTPISDLQLDGPLEGAARLNNLGDCIGTSEVSGHAEVYSQGNLVDLGTLPNDKFSRPCGISDRREVVGTSSTSDSSRGFDYSDGQMKELPMVSGYEYYSPNAINRSGQIVGSVGNPGGISKGFIYANGVATILNQSGRDSWAHNINDLGDVVGEEFDPFGSSQAFVFRNNTYFPLGDLPGDSGSSAYDINNSGQIVGISIAPPSDIHGFLYSNGTMVQIGDLGVGSRVTPLAINDEGIIVGWADEQTSGGYAFIYTPADGFRRLDTLLDASAQGWRLAFAWDINASGTILCTGVTPDLTLETVLLTPTP
jgi:probable HAF family extracellular repeat protein